MADVQFLQTTCRHIIRLFILMALASSMALIDHMAAAWSSPPPVQGETVPPSPRVSQPGHDEDFVIEADGRHFRIRGFVLTPSRAAMIPVEDVGTRALFDLYKSSLQWKPDTREAVFTFDGQQSSLPSGNPDLIVGSKQVHLDVPLLMHNGAAYLPLMALPHLLPARLQMQTDAHYTLDPLISGLELEAPEGGGVRLTVRSPVPMRYQSFMLKHPNRFVLNIPNRVLDLDRYHRVEDRVLRHPKIGDIRFDQFSFQPNVVRVVIPLGTDNEVRVLPRSTSRRLVLAIVKPAVQAHEQDLTPQTITAVNVSRQRGRVRVVLKGTGPFQYEWHRLKPPDNRFFLDLPKTVLAGPRRQVDLGDPFVSSVQVGQYQTDPIPTVRLVLELEKAAETRVYVPPEMPDTLVLEVRQELVPGSGRLAQGYGVTGEVSRGRYTVCIDPGHGGSDPGCVNRALGLAEKNITLDVARRLAGILRAAGYRVVMTRNDDRDLTYPGSSASEELGARVRVALDYHAHIFISIHCNASVNGGARGTSTHWYKRADLVLARKLHPQLVAAFNTPDKGLIRNRFYVLVHCPLPAVLVETAYLSNAREGRRLGSPDQRQILARGLADGLVAYVTRYTPRKDRSIGTAPRHELASRHGRKDRAGRSLSYRTRDRGHAPGVKTRGQALPSSKTAPPARTPISIYTTPPGAVVYIDHQRLGFSPIQSWVVSPGWHEIRARRRGYQDRVVQVRVQPGKSQRLQLHLIPATR